MRKFVVASFNEGKSNGRVQAIFKGKGEETLSLINSIADLHKEKYSNPKTYATYLTCGLLDCTSISSNGDFFHSLNSKEDFLESIGDLERGLLEHFITENEDIFNEKSKTSSCTEFDGWSSYDWIWS